ncbi:MAG: FKBP-type peptidyl-prolyl cis-trans isomerase [Bacteroidaceae bacterium]|nr:FKBP-type peptidyl-prolyl cis-trans isomerase [Bacteroidaceae bacterium]
MKRTFNLATIALLIVTMMMQISCKESDVVDEYDNWHSRNQNYIDSIARVAKANADGSWIILKSFTLGDSTNLYVNQPNFFVYAKQLKKGEGTYSPLYNDSVRVHYSGRLIPTSEHPLGFNFDKSYSTSTLNERTDVPALLGVNQNIIGFATALMHMHEGDRWMVYIPYYLGYGSEKIPTTNIPAYSTLIFDVQLARIYRLKIDTDTSWH